MCVNERAPVCLSTCVFLVCGVFRLVEKCLRVFPFSLFGSCACENILASFPPFLLPFFLFFVGDTGRAHQRLQKGAELTYQVTAASVARCVLFLSRTTGLFEQAQRKDEPLFFSGKKIGRQSRNRLWGLQVKQEKKTMSRPCKRASSIQICRQWKMLVKAFLLPLLL